MKCSKCGHELPYDSQFCQYCFEKVVVRPTGNFMEIDVDDLQDCLNECPNGKRTRQNMKAPAGLMYRYAIPRHIVPVFEFRNCWG